MALLKGDMLGVMLDSALERLSERRLDTVKVEMKGNMKAAAMVHMSARSWVFRSALQWDSM